MNQLSIRSPANHTKKRYRWRTFQPITISRLTLSLSPKKSIKIAALDCCQTQGHNFTLPYSWFRNECIASGSHVLHHLIKIASQCISLVKSEELFVIINEILHTVSVAAQNHEPLSSKSLARPEGYKTRKPICATPTWERRGDAPPSPRESHPCHIPMECAVKVSRHLYSFCVKTLISPAGFIRRLEETLVSHGRGMLFNIPATRICSIDH